MTTDSRPRGRRSRHPLLGFFPLTVIAAGTFLVVFALLMARMNAGIGGPLNVPLSAQIQAGEARARSAPLTTRSSGGSAVTTAAAPTGPAGAPAAAGAVSTRASGAGGELGRDD